MTGARGRRAASNAGSRSLVALTATGKRLIPSDFAALSSLARAVLWAGCGGFHSTATRLNPGMSLLQEFQALRVQVPREVSEASDVSADSIAEITSANWKDFARSHASTPVSRKLERTLEWYGEASRYAGATVTVDDFDAMAPLVDAVSGKEVTNLVTSLVKAELLGTPIGNTDPRVCTVTPAGWARLQPFPRGGIPGRCFVAMSFDPTLNVAFDEGIRPALVEDCGLVAIRVDLVEHNEKICDRLIAEIKKAQFMVADFTLHRAGVYFEAGYAMALGHPVIWTCRKDELGKTHFDTRQYNHIDWETPAGLRRRLTDRVRATVLE